MWDKRERTALSALIFLLVTAICLSVHGLAQPPVQGKATEDLPAGAMHDKATTACTECHEARIIVQQRLSKTTWTKEVDKMTKWGALVDASDHDALIDYLSQHFGTDRPPYEAPRTTNEKGKPGKAAK